MIWDSKVESLMLTTQRYSNTTPESDDALLVSWKDLIQRHIKIWEGIVEGTSVTAEDLDEWEILEQDFMVGEAHPEINDDVEINNEEEVNMEPDWVLNEEEVGVNHNELVDEGY